MVKPHYCCHCYVTRVLSTRLMSAWASPGLSSASGGAWAARRVTQTKAFTAHHLLPTYMPYLIHNVSAACHWGRGSSKALKHSWVFWLCFPCCDSSRCALGLMNILRRKMSLNSGLQSLLSNWMKITRAQGCLSLLACPGKEFCSQESCAIPPAARSSGRVLATVFLVAS